jgi:ribonuclease R
MKTKELKVLLLDLMASDAYEPMKYKDICYLFDVHDKKGKKKISYALDDLVNDGKIMQTSKGKYALTDTIGGVAGILQAHPKGFGFVIPETSIFSDDIFIPEKHLNGALDTDKVLVRVISKGKDNRGPEGKIVKILERGHKQIVGRYSDSEKFGFVIPDNNRLCKDIFIPKNKSKKAKDDDKVVAEIVQWHKGQKNPEGRIIEIIGNEADPGIDVLSILKEYSVDTDFSDEVIAEVNKIGLGVNEEELEKRRDLRKERIFTIDGEDARDFDDAVSLKKNSENQYILGVHIADVTHYIREKTELDREAYKRSTSIYLPDRVIPMLPFQLSNEICSLKPNEDRLTFSCEMIIDNQGKVVDYEIYKSIIKSTRRMTYKEVQGILDNEIEDMKEWQEQIQLMDELREILFTRRRRQRGSLEFDLPETKITVDNTGKAIDVGIYRINNSNKIIEEFMLVCNETIAEHVQWTKLPFIYRNHDKPDPEKIQALRNFVKRFGYVVKYSEEGLNKNLQKLLEDTENTPQEFVIHQLALRTMQQARYEGECKGHFGLAARYYTHFTSPIRRYPDLIVHRYLGYLLENSYDEKRIEYMSSHVSEMGIHTSEYERRAESIEKEVKKTKIVEYMEDKVGKEYDGIISGVTSFGFFVRLENSIEGLVRLVDLKDDYYQYIPEDHCHVGERSGVIYELGQKIRVYVSKVSKLSRQIDLMVVESD